ncbi:unnamed protein product, partial [Linum tenue]
RVGRVTCNAPRVRTVLGTQIGTKPRNCSRDDLILFHLCIVVLVVAPLFPQSHSLKACIWDSGRPQKGQSGQALSIHSSMFNPTRTPSQNRAPLQPHRERQNVSHK